MPDQKTYTSACGCSYREADVPGAVLYDVTKCERHEGNYSDRQVLLVATPFLRTS